MYYKYNQVNYMNLENVDLQLLPKVKTKDIRCIYFLYRSEELVYIGKSISLFGRIFQHIMNKNKEFDSLRYLEVPDFVDLDKLEIEFIIKYRPIYNIQIKNKYERKLVSAQEKLTSRKLKEEQRILEEKQKKQNKKLALEKKQKEKKESDILAQIKRKQILLKQKEDKDILCLLNDTIKIEEDV